MNRSNVNYGSIMVAMVLTIMFFASAFASEMGPGRDMDEENKP